MSRILTPWGVQTVGSHADFGQQYEQQSKRRDAQIVSPWDAAVYSPFAPSSHISEVCFLVFFWLLFHFETPLC